MGLNKQKLRRSLGSVALLAGMLLAATTANAVAANDLGGQRLKSHASLIRVSSDGEHDDRAHRFEDRHERRADRRSDRRDRRQERRADRRERRHDRRENRRDARDDRSDH